MRRGLNLLSAPTRVGAGPGLEPPGVRSSLQPASTRRPTLPPRPGAGTTTRIKPRTAGHGADGRAYLVELVKSERDSHHDDGQGTVISPAGTHGACGWERRRVGRRGTRVLPQGRDVRSESSSHGTGPCHARPQGPMRPPGDRAAAAPPPAGCSEPPASTRLLRGARREPGPGVRGAGGRGDLKTVGAVSTPGTREPAGGHEHTPTCPAADREKLRATSEAGWVEGGLCITRSFDALGRTDRAPDYAAGAGRGHGATRSACSALLVSWWRSDNPRATPPPGEGSG